MKKITFFLFLLAELAALSSCRNQSGLYAPRTGEICFTSESIAMLESTKAFTEATNDNLQSDGWHCVGVIDGVSTMFDECFSYDSGVYKGSSPYYYPDEGTMSFYGVYPKEQEISRDEQGAEGDFIIMYQQNPDADLMAAKATGIASSGNAVKMTFDHILAQTRISCQGMDSNVDYRLDSLILYGNEYGTYSFPQSSWVSKGISYEYVFHNGDPMELSTSSLTPVNAVVSFIPDYVRLELGWSCYNKGTDILVGKYHEFVGVNLQQGKNNHVKLGLPNKEGNPVKLTAAVNAWNEYDALFVREIAPLPGVFTVNAQGKRVQFSPGNLYWNGFGYDFETNQYDYAGTMDNPNHIDLFYFSTDAVLARTKNDDFRDSKQTTKDVLFCDKGKLLPGYGVLTKDEWEYLKAHNLPRVWPVTIDGVQCMVIVPDNLVSAGASVVKSSYTASAWKTEEARGMVAFPFTGLYRNRAYWGNGTHACLWTGTTHYSDRDEAYTMQWGQNQSTGTSEFERGCANAIRLTMELQ